VTFALLHQPVGRDPLPKGMPIWRTCLREIAFAGAGEDCTQDPRWIEDEEAYQLLVEIVSGLRSPVLGETEVQAQFKTFLATLSCEHQHVRDVGQRVLADAKTIRCRHLQGFGSHSYGSLAAQHVPGGRRVALVGAGALAADVLAALGAAHSVDRWLRRRTDAGPVFVLAEATAYGVVSAADTTIVVAAPASTADLIPMLRCYPCLREIVDLRGTRERSAWLTDARVVSLDDVFASARDLWSAPGARVAAARRAVLDCARAYRDRDQVRPFGWEDVCA
jgi:glutamyl-tRNA reductase